MLGKTLGNSRLRSGWAKRERERTEIDSEREKVMVVVEDLIYRASRVSAK